MPDDLDTLQPAAILEGGDLDCGSGLVLLLRDSQLPDPVALFGGAFFLLHPANVEAVARYGLEEDVHAAVAARFSMSRSIYGSARPPMAVGSGSS